MSFLTNHRATTVGAMNMQISILLIFVDPLFMNNEVNIHNLQPETRLAVTRRRVLDSCDTGNVFESIGHKTLFLSVGFNS